MQKKLIRKKDPLAKLAPPEAPKVPGKKKQMERDQSLATRKKNSKNRMGK